MDTDTRVHFPQAQTRQEAYVVTAASSSLPISFVNKASYRESEQYALLQHNMNHGVTLNAKEEMITFYNRIQLKVFFFGNA